jgi:hypothetical protein
VQAEVHTKLMERMTTNEELLAYVQSPAGRRFLEAAPLRPEPTGRSFSAPVGSIIWSLMAGVVLTCSASASATPATSSRTTPTMPSSSSA